MKTMPWRSHSARSSRRNSNGATLKPPSPLHRLDDNRGDARRLDRRLEQRLDRGEALLGAAAAIRVGERRVKRIGGKRPEAGLVRIHFAGERQRHQRAAVKSAGERNDRRAAGRVTRNLDGVLDRLGAGGEKDRFLRRRDRRELIHPLGELDVRLVRRHAEAGVSEGVELSLHRGHHVRMAMTDIEHCDSAAEVDVAAAVGVPDFGARRMMGEDWNRHADAARNCGGDALGQRCCDAHND